MKSENQPSFDLYSETELNADRDFLKKHLISPDLDKSKHFRNFPDSRRIGDAIQIFPMTPDTPYRPAIVPEPELAQDLSTLVERHIRDRVERGVALKTIGFKAEADEAKVRAVAAEAETRAARVEVSEAERIVATLLEKLSSGTPAEVERLKIELAKSDRQKAAEAYRAERAEARAKTADRALGRSEDKVESLERDLEDARAGRANERVIRQAEKRRADKAEADASRLSAELGRAELRAKAAEAKLASGASRSSWDPEGYFALIGITDQVTARRVTEDQLQRLFRAQSMIHHPDQGGDTARMQKMSAAYDFLKDPQNRRYYGK